MAGVGVLGGRQLQAQSSVELRTLFYSESDGRTTVLSPTLLLHQDLGAAWGQLDLLLTHDTISGASPTGGYPTLSVTTTTGASGGSSTTAAGKVPMVPYSDERKAEGISWSRRFGAHLPTIDLSHSTEKDYLSKEYGISDAWTMFEGRGTLHYGLSYADDTVSPVTRPVHLAKKTHGLALGWTWVMGENDLVDVSVSRMKLEGYLDEPYLIVPVGITTLSEHRPGTRQRDAWLLKQAHRFEWDGALKTSYRYYSDDWGLKAHTLDFTYDQRLDDGWIVSPRLRYYTQNDASFYAPKFATAQPFMSSDYRLSAMQSLLAGLTISTEIAEGWTASVGATYQFQQGKKSITPLATAGTSTSPAVYSGPGTSAADVNTTTVTVGLKWTY